MAETDREIKNTRNWGLTVIVAILVPTVGSFIWVGGLENRVSNNEKDILEIKREVATVEDDIQELRKDIGAVLVGIEQIKGRLGIIEDDR